MRALGLYFHTARHLRAIQIAGRLWQHVRRPRVDARASPPPLRPRAGDYVAPIAPAASLIAPDVFHLIGVERRCSTASDWNPGDMSRLWIYNLHYFDDLNAVDADSRRAWHAALLERWVAENPAPHGAGWEPYPVSRRIVNWVKWAVRGNPLSAPLRASLAVQARWLASRLEYHLLGNHLFVNAKALLHAGCYFAGEEAQRWHARALRILSDEVREQVLEDGGHFERSTMYHAAAVEDLLDVLNLLRAYGETPPPEWTTTLARMRRWLGVMTHPDGDLAFFNDAAFGVAPRYQELQDYASRLSLPGDSPPENSLVVLQPSGYVRCRAGSAFLLCDCAPVGPDYLPGHAHADTLSFELSLGGERLFVNSGTSQYGLGAERDRQRGTAAHNTVVVADQNSSEVWAGFRVARRARARLLGATVADDRLIVEAAHDGYRRLPGRNEHARRWTLDRGSLSIQDRITGTFDSAAAYFHLHPEIDATVASPREIRLRARNGGCVRMSFEGAQSIEVRAGTWHPRFGVVTPNRCVVATFAGGSLTTRVEWASN